MTVGKAAFEIGLEAEAWSRAEDGKVREVGHPRRDTLYPQHQAWHQNVSVDFLLGGSEAVATSKTNGFRISFPHSAIQISAKEYEGECMIGKEGDGNEKAALRENS